MPPVQCAYFGIFQVAGVYGARNRCRSAQRCRPRHLPGVGSTGCSCLPSVPGKIVEKPILRAGLLDACLLEGRQSSSETPSPDPLSARASDAVITSPGRSGDGDLSGKYPGSVNREVISSNVRGVRTDRDPLLPPCSPLSVTRRQSVVGRTDPPSLTRVPAQIPRF